VTLLSVWLINSCTPLGPQDKWDPLQQQTTTEQPASSGTGISRSDQGMSPAMADLIRRADAAIEQQQWPVATGLLERALRINPKQAEAWTRMAVVNLGQQNPQQALQMAKKSNRYARDDDALKAYNWLLMSRAYESLGKAALAEQALATSRSLQAR
jgi:tetratricopeptide (TPR) repeat protein